MRGAFIFMADLVRGFAVHNLEDFLEGEIDDMVEALRAEDKRLKLKAME